MYGIAYLSLSLRPLLSSFKNRLDKHWASQEQEQDLEGNYQEPGVEAELNFEFFEFIHNMFQITDTPITSAMLC